MSSPLTEFLTHGWIRIRGAFSAEQAAAMRDVVWGALATGGILRDDPATWRDERPFHLQHLKTDPVFRAVGSERTLTAIDQVLEGQTWHRPSDWGAFFLVFPAARRWDVPTGGWHIDADYTGPLSPARGVKVHAMFGDVEPRAGGMTIIRGSHRLVHRWFIDHRHAEGRARPSCAGPCTAIHTFETCAQRATPRRASSGSTIESRRSTASHCRCSRTPRRQAMSCSCIRCSSMRRPRRTWEPRLAFC